MGIFDSFFGGTKDRTTTSTQTTGYNAPDWLKAYLDQNIQSGIGELGNLAGTTADERILGFTPDELAAQERIRQGTGQYDDIIGNALSTLQQAQQKSFEGVNADDIQRFMNPYAQNVTDISKRKAVEDADIARAALTQSTGAASGFGGSGGLIRQMAADKNLGNRLSDIQYTGLSDAYDRALAAARQSTSDTIAAGNAIGGLATTGSNLYNRDTQALAASGEAQRALGQAKTDFTYTNPLQTILQGQQLLQGSYPLYGQTTTGSQTTPVKESGWGSQLLGGALAIGGLGTGGGSTIAGSLLSGWLNKKDGGAVKGYADGGRVSQDINEKLNPLERIIYKAGDIIPLDFSNELDLPEGILQPPRVNDGEKNTRNDSNSNSLTLPNEQFTTTSPNRMEEVNIPTNRLEAIYGSQPLAESGLTALASEQPIPEQKNRLQKMIDDTNLPLLKMGLTMMASDKPFFEAIGEGGLAAVGQIDKERERASLEARKAQEAQNEALDRQIKEQQLQETILNNKERRDIARMRLSDAQQRTQIAQQNAEVYANRAKNLKGDKKLAFENLKTQLKNINDRINSYTVSPEQLPSLEATQQQLIEQMNNLTSVQDNGNIQSDVQSQVDNVLDFQNYKPTR